jgi:hypothetical protein
MWNPKAHYRGYKRTPPDPTLSEMNQVHTFLPVSSLTYASVFQTISSLHVFRLILYAFLKFTRVKRGLHILPVLIVMFFEEYKYEAFRCIVFWIPFSLALKSSNGSHPEALIFPGCIQIYHYTINK